ncbi:hypothetical protein CLAC_09935 [Corynebacterium lactis RW2-5]|uniref:Uncharacterized protein n=1 Tax=Corynebacterium lactis RW2-5 TaxID=1408189 RepID=A0A0K2H4N9_9CORY|nr:hypothetical protein CLAC_09935 [Corynebacterium lactis RW2-5]
MVSLVVLSGVSGFCVEVSDGIPVVDSAVVGIQV